MTKLKKIGFGLMSLFGLVGAKATLAAADQDLVDALASTTAFATDNKATILTYIVGIVLIVFVIVIAKKGIMWGFAKLSGIFGRGRRR